jgi:hypothetical protein
LRHKSTQATTSYKKKGTHLFFTIYTYSQKEQQKKEHLKLPKNTHKKKMQALVKAFPFIDIHRSGYPSRPLSEKKARKRKKKKA